MVEFTVKGQRVSASYEQVVTKLRGVTPETLRAPVVEASGVTYPVKQAFSLASEIDRADFMSQQARDVRRLGFQVRRMETTQIGSDVNAVE